VIVVGVADAVPVVVEVVVDDTVDVETCEEDDNIIVLDLEMEALEEDDDVDVVANVDLPVKPLDDDDTLEVDWIVELLALPALDDDTVEDNKMLVDVKLVADPLEEELLDFAADVCATLLDTSPLVFETTEEDTCTPFDMMEEPDCNCEVERDGELFKVDDGTKEVLDCAKLLDVTPLETELDDATKEEDGCAELIDDIPPEYEIIEEATVIVDETGEADERTELDCVEIVEGVAFMDEVPTIDADTKDEEIAEFASAETAEELGRMEELVTIDADTEEEDDRPWLDWASTLEELDCTREVTTDANKEDENVVVELVCAKVVEEEGKNDELAVIGEDTGTETKEEDTSVELDCLNIVEELAKVEVDTNKPDDVVELDCTSDAAELLVDCDKGEKDNTVELLVAVWEAGRLADRELETITTVNEEAVALEGKVVGCRLLDADCMDPFDKVLIDAGLLLDRQDEEMGDVDDRVLLDANDVKLVNARLLLDIRDEDVLDSSVLLLLVVET